MPGLSRLEILPVVLLRILDRVVNFVQLLYHLFILYEFPLDRWIYLPLNRYSNLYTDPRFRLLADGPPHAVGVLKTIDVSGHFFRNYNLTGLRILNFVSRFVLSYWLFLFGVYVAVFLLSLLVLLFSPLLFWCRLPHE